MGILKKTILKSKATADFKKQLGSVADTLPVSTGFDCLDYHLATRFTNSADGDTILQGGINMGKLALFVGGSQSGKTTLAIQIANKIVEELSGDVVILDYERASNNIKARVMNICQIDEETFEERFTVIDSESIEIQTMQDLVMDIVEAKRKLSKSEMVDWYDINCQPTKIYPPTVIVVDSIPHMKGVDQLDSTNNMSAATIGRLNADMLVAINDKLQAYNITVLAINHITKKIITNMYVKTDAPLPGMQTDENLPGGAKWTYMASYAFRLYSGGAQMKEDKDYKVKGREVELRIIKSRSGDNNARLSMAMTSKLGFYAPLCNLMTLQERLDRVNGTGTSGFFFNSDPETKWKKSTFLQSYVNDESFKEKFDNLVRLEYQEFAENATNQELVSASAGKRGKAKAIIENDFDEDEDI